MSGSRHFLLCRGAPPPRSVAARSRSRRWFVAMACLVSGSVAGAVSTRARLQAGLDAQQASPTVAELRAKFEQRLQQISSRVDGVVGYSVLDLTSGDRIAHLERETFPTASTIKLAIVYELFRQAAEGRIRLDDTIALDGVRVDAGIVFAKNRPYALCVMATFLTSEVEGERAIEEMSRAAYDYFSRLGSGMLGRKLQ